jgi:hypothetical protein
MSSYTEQCRIASGTGANAPPPPSGVTGKRVFMQITWPGNLPVNEKKYGFNVSKRRKYATRSVSAQVINLKMGKRRFFKINIVKFQKERTPNFNRTVWEKTPN